MNRFPGRRLTFQLTPLLDLLLIVIFAQYLEVQETTREEIADATRSSGTIERLREEHAAEVNRLETENAGLRDRLERESFQRERLAKRFTEIFKVNERELAAALDPENPRFEGLSQEEIERLRKRLDEIVAASGGEALEHLVTYDELRKRADVWRIRVGNVDEKGEITVRAGDRDRNFRARTAEQFAAELDRIRNAIEQPKSHVVILLTYDSRSAELLARNTARDGLSRFVTRARGSDETNFFWAEIGYDPRVLGLPE